MTIRNVPAVLRIPHFVVSADRENHWYSLLLQYMPYRSDSELLQDFDTVREAFLPHKEHLNKIGAHMQKFRERDRQLENAFNQAHAFQILDEAPPVDIEQEVEEEPDEQAMSDEQFQSAQKR